MENRISPFLISVLCIGIAVLYIPILVLIGYSFNASALARLGARYVKSSRSSLASVTPCDWSTRQISSFIVRCLASSRR